MANVIMKPEWETGALQSLIDAWNANPVATDGKNALFDGQDASDLTPIPYISKSSGRIVEVRLHQPGEKIRLSDGREYEVDDNGHWIRTNSN